MEDLKKLKESLSKTDAYKVVDNKLVHSADGSTASSSNSSSSVTLTSSTAEAGLGLGLGLVGCDVGSGDALKK